jgi:hypothetical protein
VPCKCVPSGHWRLLLNFMSDELQMIVESCLSDLEQGKTTIEECQARYPQHAASLGRLLPLMQTLRQHDRYRPTSQFKSRNRAELLAYMRQNPRHKPQLGGWQLWLQSLWLPPRRLAFALSLLLLFFLMTTTTMAQAALPGEPLYRWKLAGDQLWQLLQPDPVRAELVLAERRAAEMVQVAGEETAVQQAQTSYTHHLTRLAHYAADPAQQPIIYPALLAQQQNLAQAGIRVSELERLLTTLTPPAEPAVPDSQPAMEATREDQTPVPTGTPPATLEAVPDAITPSLPEPLPAVTLVVTLPPPLATAVPDLPDDLKEIETIVP